MKGIGRLLLKDLVTYFIIGIINLLTFILFAEPNSEYVLSIRASNNMGPGPSIYATAKTQDEPPPEPTAALMPPMGLKAQVLSTTSVVLYWTDPTLKQSQVKHIKTYFYILIFSVFWYFSTYEIVAITKSSIQRTILRKRKS